MNGLEAALNVYHAPTLCHKCGGAMTFKGVGEYRCEDCGAVDYDDYGKVRNYLEGHKGATALEIEGATGVSRHTVRLLLRDGRIQGVSMM